MENFRELIKQLKW